MIKKLLVFFSVINATFIFEAKAAGVGALELTDDKSIYFDGSDFVDLTLNDGTVYDESINFSNSSGNIYTLSIDDISLTTHPVTSITFDLSSSNIRFVNNSSIILSGVSNYNGFILNFGTNNSFINNGTITLDDSTFAANRAFIMGRGGSFSSITNNGSMSGGVVSSSNATIDNINNSRGATFFGPSAAITNLTSSNSIGTINNSGTISSSGTAIINNGTITTIENSSDGIITSGSGAFGINNAGTITTLDNYGTISSATANINNSGTITTLNNAQGGANALTFAGHLPENYNLFVNSPSSYGQLLATSVSGSTNFGLIDQSVITQRSYAGVLQGLTTDNIANKSGAYKDITWNLVLHNGSSSSWDLLFTGAPRIETQEAVANLAAKVKSNFMAQTSVTNFANMNTYDCNLFDSKGMCVSIGGQNTKVSNPNADVSSTVLVVGHKISPHFRIGGFINQRLNSAYSSVDSGVKVSNKTPLIGLFGVWNHQVDGLGYQVKIANAYQEQDVKTTRDVIDLPEAGTGNTNLTTQSYVGELSYASMLNKMMIRPYLALRYADIKQDGYKEDFSISAPLSYSAIKNKSLTSLLGAKFDYSLTSKLNLTGNLGLERDLYNNAGKLMVTGVNGLTSENLNNSNIRHTRAVAGIGSYFNLTKTQRIAGQVFYQKLPFHNSNATVLYANYTVGF